jgi:hypothetical protein
MIQAPTALVFPRSKCPCNTRVKPNCQRHILFHCPIGDLPWERITQFSSNFSPVPVEVRDEKELWVYINTPEHPDQIKLALLCGIMARWHNHWTPPHSSSLRLWKSFMNETASAELDKTTLLYDEQQRIKATQKLYLRWQVPELFKLKYTSLQLKQ